jgi:saccharopine dehydrogenase (NAD+, L-lysine-forming)
MTHLWVRAEQRENEDRVGITPDGARMLIEKGIQISVEDSPSRIIPTDDYANVGCAIVGENTWPNAPKETIIFGLKELPEDGTPLIHRHIMFGHAFKGQHSGKTLLQRFQAGGGTLYDLEYLTDSTGRRVAAFGYWAGYAGAAVSVIAWLAQQQGKICGPVSSYPNKDALLRDLHDKMQHAAAKPTAIVIGALGRVGTGASDLCDHLNIPVTKWDMAETANGGPFPEIVEHIFFFNCILARPGTPIFVSKSALGTDRSLTVIGDIACDPDSDYNPIPVYDQATSWTQPVMRVSDDPILDVMAIDNLPSLLPLESSIDFANQLLPTLETIDDLTTPVWSRAHNIFQTHVSEV